MTLALQEVTKTYRVDGEAVHAVQGVSLTVGSGEFVAITGPSGSGKSTLLHLFGCLDRPTEGAVELDGVAVSALPAARLADVRNTTIGFVFQHFNLLPGLTAEENVALPAVIAGRRPADYGAAARHLLEEVGLRDKARRYPAQLSGGEQQRVAIARALINRPAVVLADEPTGNLDSRATDEVFAVLERCNRAGQTVLVVTHDMRLATRAGRVVYLRDGRVVDDTTIRHDRDRDHAIARMIQVADPDESEPAVEALDG